MVIRIIRIIIRIIRKEVKKRGNLVRSDFAEWLFPSERLHQKTSLRMIPSPVTLVDLQQIHIILKRKKDILKFGVLEGGREINYLIFGVESSKIF